MTWLPYCRECTMPSYHHDWCQTRIMHPDQNRR